MKPANKYQLLDTLEGRVEKHIQQAIKVFQNLDEATLLKPAANGGWSIAQCLEHLNSYGHYYLPQIRQKLEVHKQNSAKETFKSSWLGDYFTKMMEPETGKKKTKAFKNHIPAAKLDAYVVVAEFIRQQEELLYYLKQARKKDMNAIRIPISISRWIKLNLGDTFRFLIAHNERHIQQANRNLAV